jgi:hypothetical protein
MPKRGSIRGLPTLDHNMPCTIESACDTAAGALWDAVDLLFIHNEGPTGAEAPRGVLSPLVVLLAVSAWERFIYEVAEPAGITLKEKETVGGFHSGQLAKTLEVLRAASKNTLPNAFSVTVYDAMGKFLRERDHLEVGKDSGAFFDEFDSYVDLRNGVAHRVVPQRMAEHALRSDSVRANGESGEMQGLTINTSIARMVLAAYVQLVDQAIVHVCRAQEIEDDRVSQLRLPSYWFTDDRDARNAHRNWKPGCLWGGLVLPRMS